ncbi:orotidine-5'-phosphate decarboxylase [Bacillus sp. HMF5848]|uniref:orotidine-5'-phosphate decarboxylase n=1 Tax=Bacillus sp. HMF5848 TaxID=2495421 RepID=UPI000F7A420E|nr:orotidine-5'-phosphate decarboxylase [Bacillus sp. HMF5848]RSK26969.1 orotidine-5'-phosphate decarboxylase [Bacillus sp. HMF5848]
MHRPLIVALDFKDRLNVAQFLAKFDKEKLFVKIGMELFYSVGPSIIEDIKKDEHKVFLDLKLHDIPNTVHHAMKVLAHYEVDIVNVHATGGRKMMEAALEGLDAGTRIGINRPMCLAVTQLTSSTEAMIRDELLISQSMDETVLHYAEQAYNSGLDGVVCSAREVPHIYRKLPTSFHTVTPGIRMQSDNTHDQNRVVTPAQARENGSTGIVVGRSITKADVPLNMYKLMKRDWEGVIYNE